MLKYQGGDMDHRRRERLIERAWILKAISHPTRLFVVEELFDGEECVSSLAEAGGFGLTALSYHLQRMKNAGVLSGHRLKNQIYYSLSREAIRALREIGSGVETVFSEKTRRQKALCRTSEIELAKERRLRRPGHRILRGRF